MLRPSARTGTSVSSTDRPEVPSALRRCSGRRVAMPPHPAVPRPARPVTGTTGRPPIPPGAGRPRPGAIPPAGVRRHFQSRATPGTATLGTGGGACRDPSNSHRSRCRCSTRADGRRQAENPRHAASAVMTATSHTGRRPRAVGSGHGRPPPGRRPLVVPIEAGAVMTRSCGLDRGRGACRRRWCRRVCVGCHADDPPPPQRTAAAGARSVRRHCGTRRPGQVARPELTNRRCYEHDGEDPDPLARRQLPPPLPSRRRGPSRYRSPAAPVGLATALPGPCDAVAPAGHEPVERAREAAGRIV